MTQPSAGWFPDPTDPSRQRYFDGSVWTENYAPLSTQPPGSDLPVKPGMSKGAKIVLGVVGGIVALSVLGSIGSGADKNNEAKSGSTTPSASLFDRESTSPASASVPPATDVPAPAGSSVRDGKFEFQVLGVERSSSKQGAFSSTQAKGEFFTVRLRVTNVGDDARSFSASNQHLIIDGNNYDASSSISDEHWIEDINPGLSIDASVAFDIPPGATPEAIKVHDSMFSRGALLGL